MNLSKSMRFDIRPKALPCGVVGLPNVGKSTLFNALTGGKAPAANYTCVTKDPLFTPGKIHPRKRPVCK